MTSAPIELFVQSTGRNYTLSR